MGGTEGSYAAGEVMVFKDYLSDSVVLVEITVMRQGGGYVKETGCKSLCFRRTSGIGSQSGLVVWRFTVC